MLSSTPIPSRPCELCRKPYRPRRIDHQYCGAYCRKRASKLRNQEPPAEAPAGAARIAAAIADYRSSIRAPACAEHPYLAAYARVREAETQLLRWQRRLELRRKRLAAIPAPALTVRVQVLADGLPLQQPLPAEVHLGIASSTPDLAVVVSGRENAEP